MCIYTADHFSQIVKLIKYAKHLTSLSLLPKRHTITIVIVDIIVIVMVIIIDIIVIIIIIYYLVWSNSLSKHGIQCT